MRAATVIGSGTGAGVAGFRWPAAEAVTGARLSLWRAAVAFRIVTLVVCLALIVHWHSVYARPGAAWAAGAAMIVWTAAIGIAGWTGRAHRIPVIVADVVVTAALTCLSAVAQTAAQQHGGMVTLTTIWAAGPTIEAAFVAGMAGGLTASVLQYLASVVVAGAWWGGTLHSGLLLFVTGAVVGMVARLVVAAEADLRAAAAAQAALAERERLARSIHDGVLQVLGLVHRTATADGADSARWQAIGDAAAEQEALLRGLVTSQSASATAATAADTDGTDLAGELRALRSHRVSIATPAERVPLLAPVASEVRDAVRAALQNVEVHAGPDAHAWVLLEALAEQIRVTVRDDGVGFTAGRLDQARADGRMGVARSLRGRIEDLGGTCTITSAPGAGTEIELVVPR